MQSKLVRSPVTPDAVIVVPGIMGSELLDLRSGRLLWGLRDPRWYVRAWVGGTGLEHLKMTTEERKGDYRRVKPVGLLRAPAFAPFLRGVEPYGLLTRRLRENVLHPDAVMEFPYDWRLPAEYNAARLAEEAIAHLRRWRSHSCHSSSRRHGHDARLTIVAHSMGGLLSQRAAERLGDEIRMVITLGTPFHGAVKAVELISSGMGAPLPLPRQRMTALASALPAVYDLLPAFRCVDVGDDARRLTAEDVAAIGGDFELASAAMTERPIETADPGRYVNIVGVGQRTAQSLRLTADGLSTHRYSCSPAAAGMDRVDLTGDGTVPRQSAHLPGNRALALAQSHGALARTEEALIMTTDALVGAETTAWLGQYDLGLDVPDLIAAGESFRIGISGAQRVRDVQCRLVDARTGRLVAMPATTTEDGLICARLSVSEPGMYRVEAAGGGGSPVSELLLVKDGPSSDG